MAVNFMNAVGSIGNKFGASITGNVNKAYILVLNPEKIPKADKNSNNSSVSTDCAKNLATLAGSLQSGGRIATSMFGGDDQGLIKTANDAGYIPIKVQYNPSTLTYYGRAGELRNENVGGGSVTRMHNYNMPEETILNVELLFDDTNLTDAFMMDGSIASVGGIAGAAKQMFSGEYSVKNISELFIAAMFHPYTRLVIFAWNKTVFWGEITSADVTYSMFNKKGNPIRSKVNLQIRQDKLSEPIKESDGKTAEYDTEVYWNAAYENMFSAKTGKSVFGIDNMASNIFNLN